MTREWLAGAQGIYIERLEPSVPNCWRVVNAVWQLPGNSDCNVRSYLKGEDGKNDVPRLMIRIQQGWPEIAKPDATTTFDSKVFPDLQVGAEVFCPGDWNPDKIDHGPYFFSIRDRFHSVNNSGFIQSEYIGGFGTPLKRHFHSDVTWQYFRDAVAPPPPVHTCPQGQHWDEQAQACVDDKPDEPGALLTAVRAHLAEIPPASYLTLAMGNQSVTLSRISDGCVFVVLSDGGWVLFTEENLTGKKKALSG